MTANNAEDEPAERVAGRFLCEYHKIWQSHFPGLNKRAHWHVMFSPKSGSQEGVSCRALHRTLYGLYGTDIRTCIERIKDCAADGFIKVTDASGQPCVASSTSLIAATDKLHDSFDRHCHDTIEAVSVVFADRGRRGSVRLSTDNAAISAIFNFINAYDQKWRETSASIVRQKSLTPAHANDALDHLVTYQYWAIVMLLWWASPFGSDHAASPALVIDEINSRMWDALRLGHLAIKERVSNLIRWGFFAEQTIKKHKAVALTSVAGSEISRSLAETKPLLQELYMKVVPKEARLVSAVSA